MATKKSTAETPLPGWMRSPPTPANPEHVENIPADRTDVVEHDGNLYDRSTIYRWHRYEPPAVLGEAGPILSTLLRDMWHPSYSTGEGPDTDMSPKNREIRAQIVALATEAAAGQHTAAIERRRTWRIIDWEVRTGSAAWLEVAGWKDYAAAFRALPPITGPTLPRGAATLFRRAHRDTDKASSDALRGVPPYKRRSLSGPRRAAILGPPNPGGRLSWAAKEALPGIYRRHVKADVPQSERTDLGRAIQAGDYARMCMEYNPRIPDAEVARVLGRLAASGDALLREIVAMGKVTP